MMESQSSAENIDHHGGRRSDEFQETVEVVTLQEFPDFQPKKEQRQGSWQRPGIQKVPTQVRLRKKQSPLHVYDPVMVSFGPYHHGRQDLHKAEEFKYHCLDWYARGDEKRKGFLYNKIIEKIGVIRECYAEVTIVEKYDDKALALMMLLDACFIINFMHNCLPMKGANNMDWQNCLGAASGPFLVRDMILLENQIPCQVLKLLISLQYEAEEAEGFLQRFLSVMMVIDLKHAEIPRENEEPPIHFLEACWRVITKKHSMSESNQLVHNRLASKFWFHFSFLKKYDDKFRWPRFSKRVKKNDKTNITFVHRSVMDLKAKGIHLRPSSSPSLKDITFTSHAFSGQLQLPIRPISDLSPVVFSNSIAYEVSPNSNINLVVLSYVFFMKSLIQSPDDVKELQDKGILSNRFANLEKVVDLFKEIDTFGLYNQDIFMDVKQKIEEHCSSKAKTWIADLMHTQFRTPWTAVALFVAVFLLCLTFLQTFFTIHPIK